MRVFVTGATGYIGTALVRELIDAGHGVVGLTRSDSGAAKLRSAGAEAHRGDLDDLDALRDGVTGTDGVVHLAFGNDFSNFEACLATDLRAVTAMGAALEGSGKPFITTAHMNGEASDEVTIGLAARSVRASVVSLAPSVHGQGDKGFVPMLINIARAKGVSAYVGDGQNRWPAIHRLDAARLYRAALESAPAGSRLIGAGDEGVPFKEIAEAIGRGLHVPVVSLTPVEAGDHFGFLGQLASADLPRSSDRTRELVGWEPTHPGLISDIEEGDYFGSGEGN